MLLLVGSILELMAHMGLCLAYTRITAATQCSLLALFGRMVRCQLACQFLTGPRGLDQSAEWGAVGKSAVEVTEDDALPAVEVGGADAGHDRGRGPGHHRTTTLDGDLLLRLLRLPRATSGPHCYLELPGHLTSKVGVVLIAHRLTHPDNLMATNSQLPLLETVLNRYEISIATAQEMVALEDYEIVLIVDDSGSMTRPCIPPAQRQLGKPSKTRWEELKETVNLIIEIGCCFDHSGLDIFFLNRGDIEGVRSSADPRLVAAFSSNPRGSTPLTETLGRVAAKSGGERPVLLFVLTDGVPDGGVPRFLTAVRRLVRKESTPHTFRLQIMACTDDEDAVGWLDTIDAEFAEVDVTDDYYSEMIQVLKQARRINKFTRGDWAVKAMLGPIVSKFDRYDETGVRPALLKSRTAALEHHALCRTVQDACVVS